MRGDLESAQVHQPEINRFRLKSSCIRIMKSLMHWALAAVLVLFLLNYILAAGVGVGSWWADDDCLYAERGSVFVLHMRSGWKETTPREWAFVCRRAEPLWTKIDVNRTPDFWWKWPKSAENPWIEFSSGNALDPLFNNPTPVRYVAMRLPLHPLAFFCCLSCIHKYRRWRRKPIIQSAFPVLQRNTTGERSSNG